MDFNTAHQVCPRLLLHTERTSLSAQHTTAASRSELRVFHIDIFFALSVDEGSRAAVLTRRSCAATVTCLCHETSMASAASPGGTRASR